MAQIQIRVMCCIDPERTSDELDRAVKTLKGHREIILDNPSWWDSWHFPDDKKSYINLFLSRPQDTFFST